VPVISGNLTFRDTLGAWKARWGVGRLTYLVPPGLYALGTPDERSPAVVTANYKMSFDLVRQALAGRNLWLLVLETHGINVWCAAGKGTFGTGELVQRIEKSALSRVVSHRTLILPLLGAPGVKVSEVLQQSGFSVRFATARINDLPAYLDAGMNATPEMRQLTFTFRERLVLIPVELVAALQKGWWIFPLLYLAAAWGEGAFSWRQGVVAVAGYLGALMTGTVITPLLLPWIPSRSFALKGWLAGVAWALLFLQFVPPLTSGGIALVILALPMVTAYLTLTFTGSTPYTSRSGVTKEMRLALPAMALAILAGGVFWLMGSMS
jgi:acetyl-CoA decarbonylase/synthase complex subunit gamma